MIIVKYLKRRLKVRSFSLQTVLKYNNLEPVLIYVSVVVSNVRAVSEGMMIVISNGTKKIISVTMDYSLEMFYRESWLDKRLSYDPRNFRNKTGTLTFIYIKVFT